jgi:phosphatidylglycerophosphate synthase
MAVETLYQPTERRPIAARRWPVWQRTSVWLARAGTSANGISVAGMVCGIAAGGAFAATALLPDWARPAWIAGAVLIQLRLLANLLDGMVAIESGKASPIGELFNEVPDRVSDVAILVGAGYAAGGDPMLGYLAALSAMFTAYVRAVGKAAGAPQQFCGPMAKQQRMALLTAIAVCCGLLPAAWLPALAGHGLPAAGLLVIIPGGLLTAGRRLARIAKHLGGNKP